MEDHHHCESCGKVISPSKVLCEECGKKRKLKPFIPDDIASFLEIQPNDKLEWKKEIVDGRKVVTIRKVKK